MNNASLDDFPANESCANEFRATELVDYAAFPIAGLAILGGIALNLIIIWVLWSSEQLPVITLQIHQSLGDIIDAATGFPILMAARILSVTHQGIAGLLFYVSLSFFLVSWTFRGLVSVLTVIKRTSQICSNSQRFGLTQKSTKMYLAAIWLLSLAMPLYVAAMNVPHFRKWYWNHDYKVDLTSNYLRGLYIGTFLVNFVVLLGGNARIVTFIKKHQNVGAFYRFRRWHIKRSVNTLFIEFLATSCCQVR